ASTCTVLVDNDTLVTATFTRVAGAGPTPTPTATATPTPAATPNPTVAAAPGSVPAATRAAAPVVSAVKLTRQGALSLRVSTAATVSVKLERKAGKRWRAVKTVSRAAPRPGTVKLKLKLAKHGRNLVT